MMRLAKLCLVLEHYLPVCFVWISVSFQVFRYVRSGLHTWRVTGNTLWSGRIGVLVYTDVVESHNCRHQW